MSTFIRGDTAVDAVSGDSIGLSSAVWSNQQSDRNIVEATQQPLGFSLANNNGNIP